MNQTWENGKKRSSKIWHRQSLDIMAIFHHVYYQKKPMIQSWGNLVMDGRMDGRTEEQIHWQRDREMEGQMHESDFMGCYATNFDCPMEYFSRLLIKTDIFETACNFPWSFLSFMKIRCSCTSITSCTNQQKIRLTKYDKYDSEYNINWKQPVPAFRYLNSSYLLEKKRNKNIIFRHVTTTESKYKHYYPSNQLPKIIMCTQKHRI